MLIMGHKTSACTEYKCYVYIKINYFALMFGMYVMGLCHGNYYWGTIDLSWLLMTVQKHILIK